jgi:hypothetical protein
MGINLWLKKSSFAENKGTEMCMYVCLTLEHVFKLMVTKVIYMNSRNFGFVSGIELTFIIWELGVYIHVLWGCWQDFNTSSAFWITCKSRWMGKKVKGGLINFHDSIH